MSYTNEFGAGTSINISFLIIEKNPKQRPESNEGNVCVIFCGYDNIVLPGFGAIHRIKEL